MKRLTEQEIKLKTEKNLKVHIEANKVKDILFKSNFWYTISLYAVINNPETKRNEYRRIEVFLNSYPNQYDVGAIHNFFKQFPAYNYYTIWAYDTISKEIVLIEGFD